jgi:hypothetical protein
LSAGSSNKPVFFQVPLQVNRKAFTFQIIGLFLAPCLNFIPNKCSSQITEAELRMLLTGNAPSTTKIQLQFMFMNFFFLLEISMQLCSRQFIKYGVLAEVHVFTRVVLFSVLSAVGFLWTRGDSLKCSRNRCGNYGTIGSFEYWSSSASACKYY